MKTHAEAALDALVTSDQDGVAERAHRRNAGPVRGLTHF